VRLGIVVGLTAEARIARRLGMVAAGGGLPAGAEAASERLVSQGVTALLSFGLCGGLDPRLRPGALVVPSAVLDTGTFHPVDPQLRQALLPGDEPPAILCAAATALATPGEKDALRRASGGAVAVDLESGAVARVAARHGLPFAVLRAVCDPAERDLPLAALAALDRRGSIGILRVLGSVVRQPAQIPALLALARDAAAARRALVGRVGDLVRHGGLLVP
jgi:adenosylhomocysteine nucleosidase